MTHEELYEMARSAAEMAYAPYSKFKVGAALMTKTGQIFTGVNVESASYGATICAERTAAVKAVSEGDLEFSVLAVASSGGEAWPCGICRQFLYEFGGDLTVVTGPDVSRLTACSLEELMPRGFRL